MFCKPTVKEVNNNFRKYCMTEAKFSVNNRFIDVICVLNVIFRSLKEKKSYSFT